jgi:hypothetical protein
MYEPVLWIVLLLFVRPKQAFNYIFGLHRLVYILKYLNFSFSLVEFGLKIFCFIPLIRVSYPEQS